MAQLWPWIAPPLLLAASNIFMTFAWYGHLKRTDMALWLAILIAWGVAFFEYCLAVPANRLGVAVYSIAELKTMQEVITLCVFAAFAALWLKEPLSWSQLAGFGLIAAGAALVFFKP